jgi:hypothetical protein
MDTNRHPIAHGVRGWAVLADFSGLFLKAAMAGLAASVVVGAIVLLVANFAG